MSATTHLAMWSGPRNISTALMRSFESRTACRVIDEPLYAHYLRTTGSDHPMAAEIIDRHPSDWRAVVAELCAPLEAGTELYYQKHMAHHLTPDIDHDWLKQLDHAFLIRDPAEMIISLAKKLPCPRVEDTGLPQQLELYRELSTGGLHPPVIDTKDVLEHPRSMLSALCEHLQIEFTEAMLSWAPGRRASDGCWADYWYANLYKTTQFAQWRPRTEAIPDSLLPVLEASQAAYDELYRDRLQPS